jgi:hypothetical protein
MPVIFFTGMVSRYILNSYNNIMLIGYTFIGYMLFNVSVSTILLILLKKQF